MSLSMTEPRVMANMAKRRRALETLRGMVATWRERCRQRAELARMTPRELKDARLLPHEAWSEIRKPFWRG